MITETERVIGRRPPINYENPDGKKIGIGVGISAAAGLVIGGSAWFLRSEQAAPLRERASHLLDRFTRRKRSDHPWTIYLPEMLKDSDDPVVNEANIREAIQTKNPTLIFPLRNPSTGEITEVEMQESFLEGLELFSSPQDLQTLSARPVYGLPLERARKNRLVSRPCLEGITIPKNTRMHVKGVVDIRHGSERFSPSSGIVKTKFAVVGVDAQTVAQLGLDKRKAVDDHLGVLLGKVIFVPVSSTKYHVQNTGLVALKEKWFGKWVKYPEEQPVIDS